MKDNSHCLSPIYFTLHNPLDPSMLLQIARFHFYGCVIFHCIYEPALLFLKIFY